MKNFFRKPYVHFAGLFLLIYFLLIVIPFFSSGIYTPFMVRMSNIFFQNTGDSGFVIFSKVKTDAADTRFAFTSRNNASGGKATAVTSDFSMHYRGFLPSALLTALILASPVIRRRRIIAWIAGMSLLQIFVLIKIWLQLVFHFARHPEMNVHIYGETITRALLFLYRNLVVTPEPTLLLCVLIWIPVTFRKDDLATLLPEHFRGSVTVNLKTGKASSKK